MKDIIAKGHVTFTFLYIVTGLAYALCVPVIGESSDISTYILIYWFISMLLLIALGTRKAIKSEVWEYIGSIFFGILAFSFQVTGDGKYIFFLICMIMWLVSILYLNIKHFWLLAGIEMTGITLMVILPDSLCSANFSMTDFIIILLVVMIALWVSRNLVKTLIEIYNDTQEQEQSLDDMLAIVEAKHSEAKLATKSKSLFLSNMSHEIRTPINTILGMNEMILRESTESGICGYAKNIKTSGNMLLALINDILDASKIESGKMELISTEYNLRDIIEDVTSMIYMRALAKNLNFELIISPNLPANYIGDDVKLRQILINLLTNAVKYTLSGTITLEVLGIGDSETEHLTFAVMDTGIGIKEEDLKSLSQSFVRLDTTRNRNIEGTGLGMNIVCNYLKMMGTKLNIESTYGQGSNFYFIIDQPINGPGTIGEIVVQGDSGAENSKEQYTSAFTAPDAKILVVDDNNMNLKVFISLLKGTQVQIDTAISGKVALSMARKKRYDVIYMDHMMPVMDGIETFEALRDDTESLNRNTPVVILTANAVSGAKEMYLEKGFDGFLSKPVVPQKLEESIMYHLPSNLVKPGSTYDSKQGAGTADVLSFDSLPQIEGMDYHYGYSHLGDMDLLIKTIRELAATMKTDASYISDCYDRIKSGDDEAMDAYRIKIHSMKSSANLIGLLPLGGCAALLEYAARDERFDDIMNMTPFFLDQWLKYRKMLLDAFSEDTEVKKEITNKNVIYDYLQQLCETTENFDVHGADTALKELKSYYYTSEVASLYEELEAAVLDFDSDKVANLTEKIKSLI